MHIGSFARNTYIHTYLYENQNYVFQLDSALSYGDQECLRSNTLDFIPKEDWLVGQTLKLLDYFVGVFVFQQHNIGNLKGKFG